MTWNLQRTISKINYRIHTDAIRNNLIPTEITKEQPALVYANEADLLNVALFGLTAKEWKENNLKEQGNIRDQASLEQLIVLSNMESINALLKFVFPTNYVDFCFNEKANRLYFNFVYNNGNFCAN